MIRVRVTDLHHNDAYYHRRAEFIGNEFYFDQELIVGGWNDGRLTSASGEQHAMAYFKAVEVPSDGSLYSQLRCCGEAHAMVPEELLLEGVPGLAQRLLYDGNEYGYATVAEYTQLQEAAQAIWERIKAEKRLLAGLISEIDTPPEF